MRTPTLYSTDKEYFFPEFHSSPSYPPGYSTIKGFPIVIQQVVDDEEMTETNIGVGNEDANYVPSVMGGKTKHGTILEVADEYPKE